MCDSALPNFFLDSCLYTLQGKCRIETDVAVPCLKSGQIQLHSWLPKIPKTQYLVAYNANSEKVVGKIDFIYLFFSP